MQSYQKLEDENLARLACDDDYAAFEEIYRRYINGIYRYCYARVENTCDAEDLAAQVFLAALESLARYRGRGSFSAWLFRIARNKCADFYRAAYAAQSVTVEQNEDTENVAAATHNDPESNLVLHELLACVERMLPSLSGDRVDALRLRYWGGLSMHAIAETMRRSEGAVKMLVSRAISDLRERCVLE